MTITPNDHKEFEDLPYQSLPRMTQNAARRESSIQRSTLDVLKLT
jgi:hypothetical protein